MAHTKPDQIDDLKHEMESIRQWPGIKAKGVGVFYYKSTPFMHFHVKDGDRWADVKCADGAWKKIPIRLSAPQKEKALFLSQVNKAFFELTKTK